MVDNPRKMPSLAGSEEFNGNPLPYLVGSERTIKWAKGIRRRRLMELQYGSIEKDSSFIRYVVSHRSANWWLLKNELSIEDFVQEVELELQNNAKTTKFWNDAKS